MAGSTDPSSFFDMADEFRRLFDIGLEKELKELKKPNILVVGRSGVGKSSLINAVFGKDIAKVGSGVPITQSYARYESAEVPVVLYDSVGWLAGAENEEQFYKDTQEFLAQNLEPKDRVHLIWYAIDAPGSRFTSFDEKILKELFKDIPVLFVITKGEIATEEQIVSIYEAILAAHLPNKVGMLDVAAAPQMIRGRISGDRYGLEDLVEETLKILPDLVKKAFIAAQIVSLKMKDRAARNVINGFATGAGAVGAAPIPFADWPILLGIQASMTAAIAVLYGFKKEMITALRTGLAGAFVTMWAGKAAVDLLRLALGPLGIAFSVIDAAVAGSMTWVMGLAVAALFHETIKRSLEDHTFSITTDWVEGVIMDQVGKLWEKVRKIGPKKFIDEQNKTDDDLS